MAVNKNIFQVKHNDLIPRKGNILISEPFLQDAYFQRGVVLLVEHDKNGSMGFVINKKTDYLVNDFFPEFKESSNNIPIYLGGPVSSNRLFFIHTLGEIIPDSITISDGLYFDGDFNYLKKYILNGNSIEGKVKFFLGYSGWEGNQLGTEINDDSWMVSHSESGNIMLADGESFWKDSLELMGSKYKTWVNFPKDPLMN